MKMTSQLRLCSFNLEAYQQGMIKLTPLSNLTQHERRAHLHVLLQDWGHYCKRKVALGGLTRENWTPVFCLQANCCN